MPLHAVVRVPATTRHLTSRPLLRPPARLQGGMAYSQTYQGAKAVSATDAVAMSKGAPGKRRTDVTPLAQSIHVNWWVIYGWQPSARFCTTTIQSLWTVTSRVTTLGHEQPPQ